MAYTPTEWKCGDTISADRMNNLESGVQEALECCGGGGGSVRIIRIIDQAVCSNAKAENPHPVIDISYQEVVEGLADGTVFCLDMGGAFVYPLSLFPQVKPSYYQISFVIVPIGGNSITELTMVNAYCDTADGYLHIGVNCWANSQE